MFKKVSAVHKKGKPKRLVMDPSKIMLLKQLAIGVSIFTFVGIGIAALWFGTRVTALSITEITVEGGETISHDVVRAKVNATLEGTYLGLVPRRFAWWYPKEDILGTLSQIPRMKNPEVVRTSGQALAVRFTEYEPYALWCRERTTDACVFIDKTGYAFGEAPQLSGSAFLRYRTLGRELRVGEIMVAPADLATMEAFVTLVATNLPFAITHIETDTAGDVFYIVSGGGEFKATLKDSATVVYDNLRAILASKEFSDIKPGSFQYIDLRFGNKVFVNEEMTGASTTATTTESAVPDRTQTEVAPTPTETPTLRTRPQEEELPV